MKENKEIKNIAVLSLLPGNTEYIRNKLGIHNCNEFLEYIAKTKNVNIDQAKQIILSNSELMKIMFAIA